MRVGLLAIAAIGVFSFHVLGDEKPVNGPRLGRTVAPIVSNKANMIYVRAGQIVYDLTSSGFFGLNPNGTWLSTDQTSRSYIRLDASPAGFGTTNTNVAVFGSTPTVSIGDMFFSHNTSTGDSVRVQSNGIYSSIIVFETSTAQDSLNVMVGTTTAINTAQASGPSDTNAFVYCALTAASNYVTCSQTGYLSAGTYLTVVRSFSGSILGKTRWEVTKVSQ